MVTNVPMWYCRDPKLSAKDDAVILAKIPDDKEFSDFAWISIWCVTAGVGSSFHYIPWLSSG